MPTRTHPPNQHHCYRLDDCRALLEQMGFHMSEARSYEDDKEAVATSRETHQTAISGIKPNGEVRLNKITQELTVTNRN